MPLFLMLVIGMITSGLTLNQYLGITHGAREAVRFGATLPTGKVGPPIPDSWFTQIADRARNSSAGTMSTTNPNAFVCVAYIGYGSPEGSTSMWTRKFTQTGNNAPVFTDGPGNAPTDWCFDDGRGSSGDERRVQVVARSRSSINAVFFNMNVNLSSPAVARYEAVSPP